MGEEKNYFRPKWDDYFMALARIVATRSTCDRLRAGAVLVKENRIISTGYNGAPPGMPHCDLKHGHLMEGGHCIRTIHAEHNCLLQAAMISSASTQGATLYAKYGPCMHCAKYLVACGIKRIVVGPIYRHAQQAIDYLKEADVQVNVYEENPEVNQFFSRIMTEELKEETAPEGDIKIDITK